MKCKDLSICERVSEEIYRLGDVSNRQIAQKIGCSYKAVSDWLAWKSTPTAFHLRGMCEAGMDVIYILTGRRTINDQT